MSSLVAGDTPGGVGHIGGGCGGQADRDGALVLEHGALMADSSSWVPCRVLTTL